MTEFRAHSAAVTSLAFHPTEFLLASGSVDRTVKFWDCERFELADSAAPLATAVSSVRFSSDGQALIAATQQALTVLGFEPAAVHDHVAVAWSAGSGGPSDLVVNEYGQLIGPQFCSSVVKTWVVDLNSLAPFNGEDPPYVPTQPPLQQQLPVQQQQQPVQQQTPVPVPVPVASAAGVALSPGAGAGGGGGGGGGGGFSSSGNTSPSAGRSTAPNSPAGHLPPPPVPEASPFEVSPAAAVAAGAAALSPLSPASANGGSHRGGGGGGGGGGGTECGGGGGFASGEGGGGGSREGGPLHFRTFLCQFEVPPFLR